MVAVMYYINRNRRINVYTGFLLFAIPFYLVSPCIQYWFERSFWGRAFPAEIVFLHALLLVLVFLVVYALAYDQFNPIFRTRTVTVRRYAYLKIYLVMVICALIVLDYYEYNMLYLYFRVVFDANYQIEGPYYLLMSKFIRPLPIVMWLVFKYHTSSVIRVKDVPVLLYLLILLFPTGIPRFLSGTIYLTLLSLLVGSRSRAKHWITTTIVGMTIFFPLFNRFRFYGSNFHGQFTNAFLSEDFDSFSSIYGVLELNDLTWGRQFLGALFFWVPRSLWHNKPLSSGLLLSEELNYTYSNVSTNIIGEGYLNFGTGGVIITALFLGWYTKKLDIALKKQNVIWPVMFAFQLIFILRGDLMSSLAFTMALYMAYRISKKFILNEYIS